MKKLPQKKLSLDDRSIRNLTESHLKHVSGGQKKDESPSRPPEGCQGSPQAGSGGCGGGGGGGGG